MPTLPSSNPEEVWFTANDLLTTTTTNPASFTVEPSVQLYNSIFLQNEMDKTIAIQKEKATKKVRPPLPDDVEKLKALYKEANDRAEYYISRIASLEKEYGALHARHRELTLKTNNAPDLEEITHAIQVYCKIHKLNFRPRKTRDVVNQFIGALEHKDVPIGDDELVD
jgi:hypothetical protein